MTLSALSTSSSALSTGSAVMAAQPPAAKPMAKLGYEDQPPTDGFSTSATGNTSATAQGLKSASQAQFGLPCLIPCCLVFCAGPILAIGAGVAWGITKIIGAITGGAKAATSSGPSTTTTTTIASSSGAKRNISFPADE